MKTFILIALSIMIMNPNHAQNISGEKLQMTQEEDQIIVVTDKIIHYMIEKNLDGLNSVLDKDFTLTHMTGYVQSRNEWLSEIESEGMKYYSAKKVKQEIKISGNEAVATLHHVVDARIWGSRNTWRLQQKVKLEKRNSQWIALNSVASTF
ncbi:DUF4440 domain-containing protein [Fulvivirgaceae bacterium PWU4]|uniref:DUF4440 domain-containing protein n=1 Tax=Chryseosolibacter histidini TaxID=2782349 RepID=A0AAP2GMG7_9BACT|nr:nuclear transport factor 2 family protein [Chryseosolibacter histidini]MBT1695557.1 DUF4440 domain-containing protein [Chryseosolibacter histidini]